MPLCGRGELVCTIPSGCHSLPAAAALGLYPHLTCHPSFHRSRPPPHVRIVRRLRPVHQAPFTRAELPRHFCLLFLEPSDRSRRRLSFACVMPWVGAACPGGDRAPPRRVRHRLRLPPPYQRTTPCPPASQHHAMPCVVARAGPHASACPAHVRCPAAQAGLSRAGLARGITLYVSCRSAAAGSLVATRRRHSPS